LYGFQGKQQSYSGRIDHPKDIGKKRLGLIAIAFSKHFRFTDEEIEEYFDRLGKNVGSCQK
jgi:hypothetical protein